MDGSMRSLLRGEVHHTRRPQCSEQFLLPPFVPRNMLHAGNLKRDATFGDNSTPVSGLLSGPGENKIGFRIT